MLVAYPPSWHELRGISPPKEGWYPSFAAAEHHQTAEHVGVASAVVGERLDASLSISPRILSIPSLSVAAAATGRTLVALAERGVSP